MTLRVVGLVVCVSSVPIQAETLSTHRIDVAFSYYPEALSLIDEDGFLEYPRSAVQLAAVLREGLSVANGIFQASRVDVEFHFAGLNRMTGRRPHGVDLWYVVDPARHSDPAEHYRGAWARYPERRSDGIPLWWWDGLDGGVTRPPGRAVVNVTDPYRRFGETLAHEFGHNLGLSHGPHANPPSFSQWPGGNGFIGGPFWDYGAWSCQSTIMFGGFVRVEKHGCDHYQKAPRFSSKDDTYYGRRIGDESADAVTVLRRNVPYLAARSPGLYFSDPPVGCSPHQCIDSAGRFEVRVQYVAPNAPPTCAGCEAWRSAEMSTFRVSDHGALFYFFEPSNPEMLLKVLNGCGINGHWWVFGSAATDLRYVVRLNELGSQERLEYEHREGIITGSNGFSSSGVINDARAFSCR